MIGIGREVSVSAVGMVALLLEAIGQDQEESDPVFGHKGEAISTFVYRVGQNLDLCRACDHYPNHDPVPSLVEEIWVYHLELASLVLKDCVLMEEEAIFSLASATALVCADFPCLSIYLCGIARLG